MDRKLLRWPQNPKDRIALATLITAALAAIAEVVNTVHHF